MPDFVTLAEGFALVEGPRPDGEGGVLFSDAVGGGVHRWRDGRVETVLARRRGIGGLVPHAQGGLVVTGRDLSHDERTVFPAPEGVAGFNDLTTDDDGAVLAGALRFNPMQGEEPRPGEIWRIAPDGSAAIVLDGVVWANGLGLAPGADVLYVNDFAGDRVLACDPDGGSRRTFATVPRGNPDGLAVDEEGGVWVALGGGAAIVRFSAEGTLDALLDVPAAFVASVAFDGDDLLVATAGALLRTPAGVRGRPVAAARV